MLRALPVLLSILFSPLLTLASTELRLESRRESLTGIHERYRQTIDGIDVIGGEVVLQRGWDGRIVTRIESLANRSIEWSGDLQAAGPRQSKLVALNIDGVARLAWRFVIEERRLEPYAHYVDAATGEVLRVEPLFFTARGRVFDPNPVARLNDPGLQDQNDSASAVPDAAYSEADLLGIGGSGPLVGPYVAIVDIEPPVTQPLDAGASLLFNRSQLGFEDVNAYVHIDRAQRYLRSLGFTGARSIVDYPIPVDPHAANGSDNSYYIPASAAGRGALYFGDGGTDDAEDSDLLLHEFAHAIQDWIAPSTFTGLHASQSRALGEGFGDYWAFSTHYASTISSGRDPSCIADWDARCWNDDLSQHCGYPVGADCLRRVDSAKTMADYSFSESSGTEHRNGEIWSSALREIFLTLSARYGAVEGRRITDTVILEAHFGTPTNPTFASMGRKLIAADRLLNAGMDTAVICAAMTRRGILTAADCDRAPRGELTWFPSPQHGLKIPENNPVGITSSVVVNDSRTIEKIYVAVDIVHSARGDLRIVLIAPDGTELLLQDISRDRATDLRATYGLDTPTVDSLEVLRGRSAAGVWRIRVSDHAPLDVGTLLSWSLVIQFARDAPLATRPSRAERQFIPVVGRVRGVAGSDFSSDVHLLNRDSVPQRVTLVFTPSDQAWTTSFAAVDLVLASQQTVVLRDIVMRAFQSVGTGSLEIQSDAGGIVVWSTTGDNSPQGRLVQSIETATLSTTRNEPPLVLAPIELGDFRSNAGIAEISGVAGVVRIALHQSDGSLVSSSLHPIAPWSHIQIPLARPAQSAGALHADIEVVSGEARVVAYASLIDNQSHDPMYVAARRAEPIVGIVPAFISAPGVLGTKWDSSLWVVESHGVDPAEVSLTFFPSGEPAAFRVAEVSPGFTSSALVNVFGISSGTGALRVEAPAGILLSTRVANVDGRGTFGERVDPVSVAEAFGLGEVRDLLGIELSDDLRTNIGFAEAGFGSLIVRLTLFDAEGIPLASTIRNVERNDHVQVGVRAFFQGDLANGRVRLEVVGGDGRIIGYASSVNSRAGSPTFMIAR